MNKKDNVIIFDFDGTLADVSHLIQRLYNEMAVERGWPKLTPREYSKLRKGSIAQVIKWVGVRPWQIPGLLREGRHLFHVHSDEIKLFAGIDEVLRVTIKQGFRVFILSSNSQSTIRRVLKNNGVKEDIKILRRPSLFGKHKSLNALADEYDFAKDKMWMVGDEVRDIEAAEKAGINSIAVSWGLQDVGKLKASRPYAIADKPADILKILGV